MGKEDRLMPVKLPNKRHWKVYRRWLRLSPTPPAKVIRRITFNTKGETMNRTDIEYLDYTWNPLAMRCTPISEGCAHCWHIRMANRMSGNDVFPQDVRDAYAGRRSPVLIESRLDEPLRRRKPTRIGVQFMGDLFHEDVPFAFIEEVFGIISQTSQHTYMILTKRSKQMAEIVSELEYTLGAFEKVFPNVIGMVTAENQEQADKRIPWLLKSPFAVRGVSVEPMLSEINIPHYFSRWDYRPNYEYYRAAYPWMGDQPIKIFDGIDWIIVGCESGPGARPMQEDWVRSIRDQCVDSDVPFFYKQKIENGKKIACPELDGRQWREWPTI